MNGRREIFACINGANQLHIVGQALDEFTAEQRPQIEAIAWLRRLRQQYVIVEILADGTVRPRAHTDEERRLALEDAADAAELKRHVDPTKPARGHPAKVAAVQKAMNAMRAANKPLTDRELERRSGVVRATIRRYIEKKLVK